MHRALLAGASRSRAACPLLTRCLATEAAAGGEEKKPRKILALPSNFAKLPPGSQSKRYCDAAEAGRLKWKSPAADVPESGLLPPFKTRVS
jgi:hypothetical protein